MDLMSNKRIDKHGPVGVWSLIGIIEVAQSDRVQCQCNDCGQPVYKRIHMILWPQGRIECWGSECFAREMGLTHDGYKVVPLYTGRTVRRLTNQERELLSSNRDELIELFRQEWEQAEAARLEGRTDSSGKGVMGAISKPRYSRFGSSMSSRSMTAEMSAMREQARQIVEQRWRDRELDPDLPGWVGVVNRQVEEELRRLESQIDKQ